MTVVLNSHAASGLQTEEKMAEFQKELVRQELTELWEKVKDYRSEAAIEYYAREFNLDIDTATEHFEELLKYLCLSATQSEPLTPSDQLDQMWHAFLIQTLDYAKFSQMLGKVVNHTTMSAPQSGAYSNALKRYQENFGELHPVWRSPKLNRVAAAPTKVQSDKECVECEAVGWCSDPY
ncbi:MAG: hypothetical protein GVY17_09940 [Cyanobacteria bacterium]|jgi:hypothetical protein|nr:hypothetical protein [Cyanobacteria bacterium GSL.Bin21]